MQTFEGPHRITGIILSGGKSKRMGEDKAFIEIEGVPIINRIFSVFETLFEEIIIVANEKDRFLNFRARVYGDIFRDHGALGGLYTGLFFASFPYSFCVASDMPFLKGSVIQYLIAKIRGEDVIVPRTADGLQPLHAIYSRNCLEPLSRIIGEGRFRIVDLFSRVKTKVVEEDGFLPLDPMRTSFVNVNTPEELDRIKRETVLER